MAERMIVGEPYKIMQLSGWGRLNPESCRVYRPERLRDCGAVLADPASETLIARGLGRSYGDAAVNEDGVVDMTRLNRMRSFDPVSGILECEAGVTLEEIIEAFLPSGFFLPVTPGTKFVTVGGAIANDVHGKNHHRDGSFGGFVREIELLTASGEVLVCSPESNADVFWATVGGIGLAGCVLSAKLQLTRVPSAYISVDYHRCGNLDAALAAMEERDGSYPYSVAWVDGLASGKSLGRSVLMHGGPAEPENLEGAQADRPYAVRTGLKVPVPFDFPGFVLNPWSIQAFNTWFYNRHPNRDSVIVDYDRFFYPLDGLRQWNRMYGKRGFVQYQATLPLEHAAGLAKLLETLSRSRRASFLAVLKRFGEQGPGMLSYPMKGYTLSLDMPNHGGLMPFLRRLDRMVLDHGGRLYLAKDACMKPETLAAAYPRLEEFRAVKERLDPQHRLNSAMARRLGLVAQKEANHG